MPTTTDKQSYFLIEFHVENQYGALICTEYSLTQHEAGTPDDPNLVPVYECSHVKHMVVGPVVASLVSHVALDAIRVRKVTEVESLSDAIQSTLMFRGREVHSHINRLSW